MPVIVVVVAGVCASFSLLFLEGEGMHCYWFVGD